MSERLEFFHESEGNDITLRLDNNEGEKSYLSIIADNGEYKLFRMRITKLAVVRQMAEALSEIADKMAESTPESAAKARAHVPEVAFTLRQILDAGKWDAVAKIKGFEPAQLGRWEDGEIINLTVADAKTLALI